VVVALDPDAPPDVARPRAGGIQRALGKAEESLAIAVFVAMVSLPIAGVAGRSMLGHGVSGMTVLVQHLTLWLIFLGAALAARTDRLLALSTGRLLPARLRAPARIAAGGAAGGLAVVLAGASLDLVRIQRAAGDIVFWGIPAWAVLCVMPVAFSAIAARLVWHAAAGWRGRTLACLGIALAVAYFALPESMAARLLLPAGVALALGTLLGMPVFAAIGGAALLLLRADATPLNAVPLAGYRLTTSDLLPAIPLFALTGYLLAEGGASRRLTRLFTALVGWLPGGMAIATTGVLAFFTPLTGASGVTIVSMGGVLLPVLRNARYPAATSLGLVTVSGSIGLLFFPSLPVFMYAFYANQPFAPLFIAGILPGVLLVAVVAVWAAARGWGAGAARTPFDAREAAAAVREAKWEIGLPIVMLGTILSGVAGLIEAAALSVVYMLIVECALLRGLRLARDLPRLAVESATMIGGFMIILSVALGLTDYLLLVDVPSRLLAAARTHIDSPLVFLLALNVLLILVGALMDIYSAIVVVVPMITPIAAAYGVDPVHLGIIFLANMELGYLMPPMGENLFLSSYRFDRPLTDVYRSTLPYTLIILAAVLLITYVPRLTLWLVD
jgi:tripartite ATP-independent transporter DctM subunit